MKFDDNFSHLDRMHERDRQTDTGRQQRPRLRIASRAKNKQNFPIPLYFAPQLKGFPWNWVLARGVKRTRVMGLPGR